MVHLGGRLRLADVARAARMSPYHFHRVFQAMMGETLAEFVKRQRLERAVRMMAFPAAKRGRRTSLTTIGRRCGFSSTSDFSRSFKQRFGAAPSGFDIAAWRARHGAELEKTVEQMTGEVRLKRVPPGENPDGFRVRVRELPARTVAYIRVRNPYRGDDVVRAAERLMAWADARGLGGGQWLGYQWEIPEITALEKCQYFVAVEAPAGSFTPSGEIGQDRFPKMLVAQIEMRGGIDLELRALQWLYGSWLPRSGYEPDDQPAFEAWIGRPFAHGMEHFELFVQVPVR